MGKLSAFPTFFFVVDVVLDVKFNKTVAVKAIFPFSDVKVFKNYVYWAKRKPLFHVGVLLVIIKCALPWNVKLLQSKKKSSKNWIIEYIQRTMFQRKKSAHSAHIYSHSTFKPTIVSSMQMLHTLNAWHHKNKDKNKNKMKTHICCALRVYRERREWVRVKCVRSSSPDDVWFRMKQKKVTYQQQHTTVAATASIQKYTLGVYLHFVSVLSFRCQQ